MPHRSWMKTYFALALFILPFGAGGLALAWTTEDPALLGLSFLVLTCFMFAMMRATDADRYRVDAHEVDSLIEYASKNGVTHMRFLQIFAEVSTKRVNLQTFMTYREYLDIKAIVDREIQKITPRGVS